MPDSAPFHELSQFTVDPDSVRLLGRRYCQAQMVVVLGVVDPEGTDAVTLGMLDPAQGETIAEVEKVLGRKVAPVRLNAYEIRRAIESGHGAAATAEYAVPDRFQLTLKPVKVLTFDEETPITHLLNEVLGSAIQLKGSDVHLETYADDVDVRVRVDGVLHHLNTALSRDNIAAAISRLKVLAGLDIAEKRTAQDGRIRSVFEVDGVKRVVDFRLSVVPGPFGEDAVMRILDSAMSVLPLEELGMHDRVLPVFQRLVENPEGLVLVVGPTGSGKTTTLYAALHRTRSPHRKVLTVEDPIEYHFDKINQKQVGANMAFADYARAFMRQNPDVILIGEVRDEETADVAMRAAQTGHLVLSTLHTADGPRTVSRLRTLGVDPNLVANCLLGSLSQRLLRRLCVACRRQAPPDTTEAERLGVSPTEAFWRAAGCDACRGLGVRGRIGVFELFAMDEDLAELVTAEVPSQRLRARAREKGMRSMLDDALDKARAGHTSLREILRVVPYRMIEEQREERAR